MIDISIRMSQISAYLYLLNGWMDEFQGLNEMKKGELIEESQKEEYTLYVIDLWKKTICLTYRLYSNGEKNTIK